MVVRLGPTALKLIASVLLAVPIAVLLLFAIAETAGGELSGAQHLVQAAPLLTLLILAWWLPRIAGLLLLLATVLLFVLWFAWANPIPDEPALLLAAPILFLPPLLAGWLLLSAGGTEP